ncbi:hypothetical protein ASE14_01065 [Agromyces sp. Root81]|nr:hypothetical protein ASE14_01065 [Agromyces sp. Root81]
MSSREFARWYWLKEELGPFACSLGIRATGSKEAIAARISAALDGKPAPREVSTRRSSSPQLSGPLSESTVVPTGQRCSQVLRAWFSARLGDQFRFDGPMRDFFAAADGTTTLGDAERVWHETRDRGPDEIGGQFELNRFTRHWHEQNPGGSREQLMRAWAAYRDTPMDVRGKISATVTSSVRGDHADR